MALYVISVGGSLIVPNDLDIKFLSNFKKFIIKRIEKKDRFIFIAGGGKLARKYQEAASRISEIDDEEKDWIGIHSTRLNAHLLRTIFKAYANPKIFHNLDDQDIDFKEKILIGAGCKPGRSTDYIAIFLAKKYNADSVINLSNIEYVYSEDPRKNPDAKKYKNISWKDFRKITGNKWNPGLSLPFDPIASQEAEKSNLNVVIMSGKDLKNLDNYLENKEFKGTLIK